MWGRERWGAGGWRAGGWGLREEDGGEIGRHKAGIKRVDRTREKKTYGKKKLTGRRWRRERKAQGWNKASRKDAKKKNGHDSVDFAVEPACVFFFL